MVLCRRNLYGIERQADHSSTHEKKRLANQPLSLTRSALACGHRRQFFRSVFISDFASQPCERVA